MKNLGAILMYSFVGTFIAILSSSLLFYLIGLSSWAPVSSFDLDILIFRSDGFWVFDLGNRSGLGPGDLQDAECGCELVRNRVWREYLQRRNLHGHVRNCLQSTQAVR
jgi:hypothetical protein